MDINKMKIKIAALVVLASIFAGANVRADDTSANISIAKFITNMKMGGDFRLRQENFWRSTNKPNNPDRSRQRFRLRWGLETSIQDVIVKFRLASGTGEQVSTNQTFDNSFVQKQIWIDQASLSWKAFEWLKISGGKMENPNWTNYTSDIVWDADLNPEGFAEQLDYSLNDRIAVFGNFGQFPLKETSGDTRDPWMFSNQIGVRTKVFDETKINIAANYIKNQYENSTSLAPNVIQKGNNRFPGSSISSVTGNYDMYHLTGEIATRVWIFPLDIQGDYVINNGELYPAKGAAADNKPVSQQDIVGYQVGFIAGKAKSANTWEAAYFFKYAEFNCTLADFADSDFGDGGLNRKGHIMWIAYAPRDYIQLKAKLFVTETLHAELSPGLDNINRFQLDCVVKF